MTPHLVEELERCGIRLRLQDDRFVCRAPKGRMTDIQSAAVREVREDLILWLRGEALLCYACCRVMEEGQPAGQGAALVDGRLYHMRCLPDGYAYDAIMGAIRKVDDTLFDMPSAAQTVAAMAR